MTDTIKVRPTKAAYIPVLSHPQGPPLTEEGVLWPYDGFTCQLLAEGSLERVEQQAEEPLAAHGDAPEPAHVDGGETKLLPMPPVQHPA